MISILKFSRKFRKLRRFRKLKFSKKDYIAAAILLVIIAALLVVALLNRQPAAHPGPKTKKSRPAQIAGSAVASGQNAKKSPSAKNLNSPVIQPTTPVPKTLFFDALNGPDRIVTNEFSNYNPAESCPYKSDVWEMTSGTLLIKNGAGYSGAPTQEDSAICESSQQTDSATFRLNTRASGFGNIELSLDYQAVKHGGPGVAVNSYDGIHIWVGYQSEYALYAISVLRWDGVVVIKKKVPVQVSSCDDVSNDGCYYDLSPSLKQPATVYAANAWHHADIQYSSSGGYTTINLIIDGRQITNVVDKNEHGPAYLTGAVGVRGDNTEFYFKNFKVTNLN